MIDMTRQQLKLLAKNGHAIDITYATGLEHADIMNKEKSLTSISCSHGTYGLNGKLYHGDTTGALYVIYDNGSALYLFG